MRPEWQPKCGRIWTSGRSQTRKCSPPYATETVASSESSRSMMPPWPGSRLLMSLMPRSRLIIDSARSPRGAATTATAPSPSPIHQSSSISQTKQATPTSRLAIAEPAKPSQVFFGLITGPIGCRPNTTPPGKPPTHPAGGEAADVGGDRDEDERQDPLDAVVGSQQQRHERGEERQIQEAESRGGDVADEAVLAAEHPPQN